MKRDQSIPSLDETFLHEAAQGYGLYKDVINSEWEITDLRELKKLSALKLPLMMN